MWPRAGERGFEVEVAKRSTHELGNQVLHFASVVRRTPEVKTLNGLVLVMDVNGFPAILFREDGLFKLESLRLNL